MNQKKLINLKVNIVNRRSESLRESEEEGDDVEVFGGFFGLFLLCGLEKFVFV